MRRFTFAGLVAVAVIAIVPPLVVVMACGPDFEPEVFVPAHHPASLKLYADGHLGVLQRGYFHADLVVAYRYLSGGRLSAEEQAAYAPPPAAPYNAQDWQARREAEVAARPNNRWWPPAWRTTWMERRASVISRRRGRSTARKAITPSRSST